MKHKNISFYLKKRSILVLKISKYNNLEKNLFYNKLLKIFFFQNYTNYAFIILLYLCIILEELFKNLILLKTNDIINIF